MEEYFFLTYFLIGEPEAIQGGEFKKTPVIPAKEIKKTSSYGPDDILGLLFKKRFNFQPIQSRIRAAITVWLIKKYSLAWKALSQYEIGALNWIPERG